jgi:flagellar biosynthesis/type III secretory pathway protein FliH
MKPTAVKLQIPLSVGSVQVVTPDAPLSETAPSSPVNPEFKKKFSSLCDALNRAADDVNAYGQNLFAIHRDQIVHLAVQIAARILAQEIETGQYKMENILATAIEHAPAGQTIEIHLNPEDYKTCEAWLKNEQTSLSREIKLTQDSSIQRAECIVYTPEGIMEYRIEEHLRLIEAAMIKQNSMMENKSQNQI